MDIIGLETFSLAQEFLEKIEETLEKNGNNMEDPKYVFLLHRYDFLREKDLTRFRPMKKKSESYSLAA